MRVVGLTLVDAAVKLDFPVAAAVASILPLCDEVVANVGPTGDGTAESLAELDPRVRVVRGVWDRTQGRAMLAAETDRALAELRGDWAVYVQADEVLHEDGVPRLRAAMEASMHEPLVEGLLVDYLHFYGNFDTVATNRAWYRREVRVVRLGCGVTSFRDAQGFRVAPTMRRVRARSTGATMFHYGWSRRPAALHAKREADRSLFPGRPSAVPVADRLPWQVGLVPFRGTHPRAAAEWIASRGDGVAREFQAPRWSLGTLRLAAALVFERLTGWRPFEFRNYELV